MKNLASKLNMTTNPNIAPRDAVQVGDCMTFRYYLGRMTSSACMFAQSLTENWDNLDDNIKQVIENDLESEFKRDDISRLKGGDYHPLGMDFDREYWKKLRAKYKD